MTPARCLVSGNSTVWRCDESRSSSRTMVLLTSYPHVVEPIFLFRSVRPLYLSFGYLTGIVRIGSVPATRPAVTSNSALRRKKVALEFKSFAAM